MLTEMKLDALLRDIEMPLVEVLADMEWEGITIDLTVFRRLSEELGKDLRRLEQEIARVAGTDLNINSPRQLATILFEKHQLPILKKTKTGPSTDADVLEQLAAMGHDLPAPHPGISRAPEAEEHLCGRPPSADQPRDWPDSYQLQPGGGRHRPAQLGRAQPSEHSRSARRGARPSGPASCPGKVGCSWWPTTRRSSFGSWPTSPGDPAFIEAFRQGGDIHRQTAALIFNLPLDQVTSEMRARAKTINFATIYGQGPFALSRQLGISQDDAKGFIARYFERFSGVRAFLDRQIELARQQGYVETLFKRRRYIPEIKDRNFNQRAYGERNAQNSPLQGSAADLIKFAMVRIHRAIRERGLSSRMLLQVHDELIFEAPPDEVEVLSQLVRAQMENVTPLLVPLVVDIGIGPNWLEAKS